MKTVTSILDHNWSRSHEIYLISLQQTWRDDSQPNYEYPFYITEWGNEIHLANPNWLKHKATSSYRTMVIWTWHQNSSLQKNILEKGCCKIHLMGGNADQNEAFFFFFFYILQDNISSIGSSRGMRRRIWFLSQIVLKHVFFIICHFQQRDTSTSYEDLLMLFWY